MLTAPNNTEAPITPLAVILNEPASPTMSASALLTLSTTPIASSARYSTEVATMTTMNSTNDTAKANFITDHGSIRLRWSRARRGPRPAAPATVARADRTTSVTLAAPTAGPTVSPVVPRPGEDTGACGMCCGVTTGALPVARVSAGLTAFTGAVALTGADAT